MSAPPSTAIREKSDRLLVSGAVTVRCSEDGLSASVVGDHGRYLLIREGDYWRCTCPSRVTPCSHSLAVSRVTA